LSPASNNWSIRPARPATPVDAEIIQNDFGQTGVDSTLRQQRRAAVRCGAVGQRTIPAAFDAELAGDIIMPDRQRHQTGIGDDPIDFVRPDTGIIQRLPAGIDDHSFEGFLRAAQRRRLANADNGDIVIHTLPGLYLADNRQYVYG
jgi:hypothetical protein